MMRTYRFFRYIWRINAVLILLVAGGVCLLIAGLTLSEVGCAIDQRRAVEAAPPVVADTEEKLYLGPLIAVEGSPVLRGELLGPRQDRGIGSVSYDTETRNILYLDIGSTDARWLLPDSARVISKEATIWSKNPGRTAQQPVAGLVLVKPNTTDLELAEGTLMIFDASGRQVTTVAEGVRVLNHASLIDSDSILVLYEREQRYVRAIIDARSLKVTSVHDISVPDLQ